MPVSIAALAPDDLLSLPKPKQGGHYELSDGGLIIVGNAGALQELIKMRLFDILTEYRLQNKDGRSFAETQFTLRADRARIPDVAWVSQAKLDLIPRENRAIPIAPDVSIEVISDSEQPEEMEEKLRDYLQAGVEVWQVFSSVRSITKWCGNEGIRLEGSQVLTSERLPGLSMPVSDVFSV